MNFIKLLIIATIIFFIHNPILAQDKARSSLFVEVGGSGGILSFNYDRLLGENLSIRAGLAPVLFGSSSGGGAGVIVPVLISYLSGEGSSKLEVGVGLSYIGGEIGGGWVSGTVNTMAGTAFIGYRYQKLDGGFFFRVGFTPLLLSDAFLPWGGISIGTTF